MKPAILTTFTAAFVALLSPAAGAASFTFTATVPEGPFAGTVGTGLVDYPEDAQSLADDVVTPEEGLTLSFNLFGQDFTEVNDVDHPLFPVLELSDGTPVFLDFLVAEDHPFNPTAITQEGVFSFWLVGELVPLETGTGSPNLAGPASLPSDYTLPVFINVPEPPGTALAVASGLGLGGLIFSRWRRRQRG